MAGEGVALPRRPTGVVPVVLPLLHGPEVRGRRAADQEVESDEEARRADREALHARRHRLPHQAEAGAAELGLRQQEDIAQSYRIMLDEYQRLCKM